MKLDLNFLFQFFIPKAVLKITVPGERVLKYKKGKVHPRTGHEGPERE
jgi:hypothetical protein